MDKSLKLKGTYVVAKGRAFLGFNDLSLGQSTGDRSGNGRLDGTIF